MKRKKKEKIRCKWNVVEKRALLGDALSPNYPTSLVLLYEITCCRQDAAVACITPHKRTPPQFGHPESRNDSYRLTPKPRITWHTGWPAARQPSILRIYLLYAYWNRRSYPAEGRKGRAKVLYSNSAVRINSLFWFLGSS